MNIEMQRADEKNMVKRRLYYWSKIFSSAYQGKGRYSSLPRTICINVLDFNLLDEEHFHNTYILKNKENNNLLTNTLELHFVEIPKMKEIDQNDMLSLWTAFLNDPNNEKLIELEAKYEELHEAKVELARLSRDPKEAEKYRMRENAINERRNFFLETLDKGLKEGEKKAKIKIALKLKESLDINTISEMTDLSVSELEEIFSGKTI